MKFDVMKRILLAMLPTLLFLIGGTIVCYGAYVFNPIIGLVVTGLFMILVAFMIDKGQGGET